MTKERWVFDVEVFPNLFCVTFLNIATSEKLVFSLYKEKNDIEDLVTFLDRDMYLVGYNNISYDNIILQYIVQNKRVSPREIFIQSSKVISIERGGYDQDVRALQYAPTAYSQIDLMKIIEVNGNVPSLKQVGINLQWHKIQDLPYDYDHVVKNWDEANKIISYNLNDVLISEKLYHNIYDQIELREKLSNLYNLDLMSCSDSKIGDKLLVKFYKEKTGGNDPYLLKNKVTEYSSIKLSECIYPDIKFETNYMKRIKRDIERSTVRSPKFSFSRLINFGGVEYQIAAGGLHSVDTPAKFLTDEKYIIRDVDFASYYTSMMIKNNVVPKHVGNEFREILQDITNERVKAKKNDKVKAQALKITVNAIYGKLGFVNSWFRDSKAVLQVTIPGQLYLLMLIEKFVLAGIEVISANTDGIVCRINRKLVSEHTRIANEFAKELGIGVEFTDYEMYLRRDVNNYLTKKSDGETKYKGCYIPEIDVKKSYKYPIVPVAVYNYIINNIPIEKTILDNRNILDFCASQKMGGAFQAEFHQINNETEVPKKSLEEKVEFLKENGWYTLWSEDNWLDGSVEYDDPDKSGISTEDAFREAWAKSFKVEITELQKTNRFYICKSGGKILKRNKKTGKEIGLFVGQKVRILNDYFSDVLFDSYDIDYYFYISEALALIEDSKLYQNNMLPFVDEDENYKPEVDEVEKEEFFYNYESIKGLPEKIVEGLYSVRYFEGNFLDFLVKCEKEGFVHSKWNEIIRLNLFSKFGGGKKLLAFFLEFREGKNKYTSKLSEKGKEKRLANLGEIWNTMSNEEFSVVDQIKNELEILGRIQTKFNVDWRYFFVTEVSDEASTGNPYSPKVSVLSLGTGNSYNLKISKKIYHEHLKNGNVIFCESPFERRPTMKKVGTEWVEVPDSYDKWMNTYRVVNPMELNKR